MVFFRPLLSSLASATLVACATLSTPIQELSFGYGDGISHSSDSIPHFQLSGPTEILSNKVILTPISPGGQRGSIWADKVLENADWSVEVDFRASGPERGGGNLQIWYVKDGRQTVDTSSIYTVGKFDGLALVIDQYSGTGGFIRGFLNDGSNEYKSHHSVDSLAFGHCEYSYRNLGRPSILRIRHSPESFRVEVDERLCFESRNIRLPLGYNIGITAATTENPDSFEIFKLVTASEQTTTSENHKIEQVPEHATLIVDDPAPASDDPPETPASSISSHEAQFADLHNRLQAMMRHIGTLNRDVIAYQRTQSQKTDELTTKLSEVSLQLKRLEIVYSLQKTIDEISGDVKQSKRDLVQRLDTHMSNLRTHVAEHHNTLLENVLENAPSVFVNLLIVIGSQGLLVAAYLLYKRRKANSPKKYL